MVQCRLIKKSRSHIGRVLDKLGAHSQVQAAAIASRGAAGNGFKP
jgi:hypothetical protein